MSKFWDPGLPAGLTGLVSRFREGFWAPSTRLPVDGAAQQGCEMAGLAGLTGLLSRGVLGAVDASTRRRPSPAGKRDGWAGWADSAGFARGSLFWVGKPQESLFQVGSP